MHLISSHTIGRIDYIEHITDGKRVVQRRNINKVVKEVGWETTHSAGFMPVRLGLSNELIESSNRHNTI